MSSSVDNSETGIRGTRVLLSRDIALIVDGVNGDASGDAGVLGRNLNVGTRLESDARKASAIERLGAEVCKCILIDGSVVARGIGVVLGWSCDVNSSSLVLCADVANGSIDESNLIMECQLAWIVVENRVLSTY